MRNAREVIAAANAQQTNIPAFCQGNTVRLYQVEPVGDVNHDGHADAVDGWRSEPATMRHSDRYPMVGAPVAWYGGSGGFGHRAICVGYDKAGNPEIRSTDANGRGIMGTRPLSWFETTWGLHYLGWSETISGHPIQGLFKGWPFRNQPTHKVPANVSRGPNVDAALTHLRAATAGGNDARRKALADALRAVEAIPHI